MTKPEDALTTFFFVDQFSSLDDIRRRDENNSDIVLAVCRKVRRFSCFEMSERPGLWRTVRNLANEGHFTITNNVGYPWTAMRFPDEAPTLSQENRRE